MSAYKFSWSISRSWLCLLHPEWRRVLCIRSCEIAVFSNEKLQMLEILFHLILYRTWDFAQKWQLLTAIVKRTVENMPIFLWSMNFSSTNLMNSKIIKFSKNTPNVVDSQFQVYKACRNNALQRCVHATFIDYTVAFIWTMRNMEFNVQHECLVYFFQWMYS